MRHLEIGPGSERLEGFETLNLVAGPFTDHVGDCRRPPFAEGSFDLVYSSHCVEHVEWHEVEATIAAWARILKPGGVLEVHTVNGYAMMKGLVELEETGATALRPGGWKRDLTGGDPYLWAVGRLLNYPKARGGTHWMHRAIITPAFLAQCFARAGLGQLRPLAEPRGAKKHRGVNMGLSGVKC